MLQLKPATEADREYVRHTQHAAYREMVIRQFGPWEQSVQDGFFDRSWKDAPRDLILFDGKPCGFCRIDEHPTCLQLVEFAIDVEQQGHGIGSQFLALFKAMAAAKGKHAQLNVMKTNARAKALYERCGFTVYGENHVHFMMRSEPVAQAN
jgi:ribosomal protein S18 acetylase RimI-like enzyme